MKFATIRNHTRDGQLVVVSRDLSRAIAVPAIATTMQAMLDNWQICQPLLKVVYDDLNNGKISDAQAFADCTLAAPLPRAYQWADGSAYVNHVELVRQARGATMPENFWHDPLMYQGGSDAFLSAHDDIVMHHEEWGIDFESEIGLITTDVPMGVEASHAANYIALFVLINDVSLRNLIPNEIAKSFGFFQSKPSSSFSPVAVTPDELGEAWDGAKIHLPLITHFNQQLFGAPNAGIDMTFDFPTLIAHAAKTRPLGAGTIIGSGTISNYDRSKGSSCIAEKRMLEIINDGKPSTPFMKSGDTVKIEMLDNEGHSIFGAIEQTVEIIKEAEVYAKTV